MYIYSKCGRIVSDVFENSAKQENIGWQLPFWEYLFKTDKLCRQNIKHLSWQSEKKLSLSSGLYVFQT